jgi:hypothetical protein
MAQDQGVMRYALSVGIAISAYIGMLTLWVRILGRTARARAFLITAIVYVPAHLVLRSFSVNRCQSFAEMASDRLC